MKEKFGIIIVNEKMNKNSFLIKIECIFDEKYNSVEMELVLEKDNIFQSL